MWQVGCGAGPRDYREVLFSFGIVAMGARGDEGPYDPEIRPYNDVTIWEDAQRKIRALAVDMDIGDTIILKHGKKIVGIGKVTGEYLYDDNDDWKSDFSIELMETSKKDRVVDIPLDKTRLDDVEGWDLMHTRRVDWWRGVDFPCNSLSRGACDWVYSEKTIKCAKIFIKTAQKVKKKRKLPEPANELENDDIISHLINHGLSSTRSEQLSDRLQTLQRLAQWYYYESSTVSEYEVRAYLVWPLLQVLGWSEQCVKIEWKKLDLALFHKPYVKKTEDQIPYVVGETKRLFSGLSWATKQAEDYAKDRGCKNIMVTDGIRYMLHTITKRKRTSMYMNLLKLRDRHPYYKEIKGANDLLTKLLK